MTKRELSGADQARRLYVIMGRPSEESFELMIKKGKIINNLVTIMDFRNAKKVYGKDLGTIKGKTARQKAPHVLKEPNDDPEEKQVIVLSVDIMNFGSTFFLLLFQELSDLLPQLQYQIGKKKTVWNALKHVINVYRSKEHTVEEVEFSTSRNEIHTTLADDEFKMLREDIEDYGVKANIVTKEEHVPEVERQIRVIKERAHAKVQTLPY